MPWFGGFPPIWTLKAPDRITSLIEERQRKKRRVCEAFKEKRGCEIFSGIVVSVVRKPGKELVRQCVSETLFPFVVQSHNQ